MFTCKTPCVYICLCTLTCKPACMSLPCTHGFCCYLIAPLSCVPMCSPNLPSVQSHIFVQCDKVQPCLFVHIVCILTSAHLLSTCTYICSNMHLLTLSLLCTLLACHTCIFQLLTNLPALLLTYIFFCSLHLSACIIFMSCQLLHPSASSYHSVVSVASSFYFCCCSASIACKHSPAVNSYVFACIDVYLCCCLLCVCPPAFLLMYALLMYTPACVFLVICSDCMYLLV